MINNRVSSMVFVGILGFFGEFSCEKYDFTFMMRRLSVSSKMTFRLFLSRFTIKARTSSLE